MLFNYIFNAQYPIVYIRDVEVLGAGDYFNDQVTSDYLVIQFTSSTGMYRHIAIEAVINL